MLERIREATLHGWPLGDDGFLEQIERDFDIRPRRGKPGRPRKLAEGQLGSTACSGSLFGGEGPMEIGN
jgi:hypothetical protein